MAELFERYKAPLIVVLSLLLVGGSGALALRHEPPAPVQIVPPAPTATPAPVRVHVSGAVNAPAVYTLPQGAIVQEAIDMAGGATDDALLDTINLARPLVDGEQIAVPREGETVTMPTPPNTISSSDDSDAPASTGPVNINTATLEQLDTLPGVGPVIAQRIIDYRTTNGPFTRIEEIQNVNGIGPATFAEIRDLITVD